MESLAAILWDFVDFLHVTSCFLGCS